MSLFGDIGSFVGGGPIGYGLYKGLSGNGSSKVSQVPLIDPAQEEARKNLLEFSKTGKMGSYTAGTPYGGSLGDFGLSALESSGLGHVQNNLTSGPGALATMGSGALSDLLTTDKFNPLNQTGMIHGLTDAIDYNTGLATDAAKRSASYTGNLYSTDAVRNLGNVQAQGNNTKAGVLSNLYSQYVQQKLGAIPQAFTAQQSLNQGDQRNIENAFTYGGVQRNLNTAGDQAKYGEFQRQQQEKQGQVTAGTNLSGSNVPYGVPNVSIPNANPWMDVMNLLASFGGKVVGGYAGGAAMKAGAA